MSSYCSSPPPRRFLRTNGTTDGGWYDETPPSVIGATPGDGSVNAKAKKINIFFDEFIKLENASEKVVVSPPQLEQPEIKATGKAYQRGTEGLAEGQHHLHRGLLRRHQRQQ